MKCSPVRNLSSVMLLIGGMAGYHAAYAADPAAEQKIPATAEGIWKTIDQQSAELDKVIRGGALEEVHHHAFAIRDLAAALPERSQSLPADKLAKIKGSVKFVATLAERLDATGDAKDTAGTQANFDKLKQVLEGMRGNYAKGPSKAEGAHADPTGTP